MENILLLGTEAPVVTWLRILIRKEEIKGRAIRASCLFILKCEITLTKINLGWRNQTVILMVQQNVNDEV